jgi:uncharacterized protein with PIN domain
MLGRLATWLRLAGFDAAYENEASDLELARRARAEGRALVTRDHELADRRGLRTLLIHSENLDEQFHEVLGAFPLDIARRRARCALCNEPLEAVDADEIADRVPPYVSRTYTEFQRCPACRRVYWPGSHHVAIERQLRRFLARRADST